MKLLLIFRAKFWIIFLEKCTYRRIISRLILHQLIWNFHLSVLKGCLQRALLVDFRFSIFLMNYDVPKNANFCSPLKLLWSKIWKFCQRSPLGTNEFSFLDNGYVFYFSAFTHGWKILDATILWRTRISKHVGWWKYYPLSLGYKILHSEESIWLWFKLFKSSDISIPDSHRSWYQRYDKKSKFLPKYVNYYIPYLF